MSRKRHRINRFFRRMGDTRKLLGLWGETIEGEISEAFDAGLDPYGNQWDPLSDITVSLRREKSDKPLQDTGYLLGSINYQVNKKNLRVGTMAEHAAVHQFGALIEPQVADLLYLGTLPNGKGVFAREVEIPARTFLALDGMMPTTWDAAIREATDLFAKRI